MATEWRNQIRRTSSGAEMVAIRMPADLKSAVQKIAEANNTTMAAIVRHSIERFVEDHETEKPPPRVLFD